MKVCSDVMHMGASGLGLPVLTALGKPVSVDILTKELHHG